MSNHGKSWTNEEDLFLSENYESMNNKELAFSLSRTVAAIITRMQLLFLKRKSRFEGTYALYKGEDLLQSGTTAEIAKSEGTSKEVIYFYTTPSYKKRIEGRSNSNNAKVMVSLDE